MNRPTLLSMVLACGLVAGSAPASAAEPYAVVKGPGGTVKTALFSEENAALPVAQVEDQVVTLHEFAEALAEVHGDQGDQTAGGKKDFKPVLDRLIGARLIAVEAHDMGLDELPAVKKEMADFSSSQLREALRQRLTKGVAPDANQVELYFRDAVQEWKLSSILFAKEADAKQLAAAVKAGKSYEALATQATAAKKATAGPPSDYVAVKKMLPQVAAAVQGLFKGQVSEAVQVQEGWAVVQVADVRYPEDAKARGAAEERSLTEQQEVRVKKSYAELVKKYAVIDQKRLKKLDFEVKKPNFAARLKDKQVLARVQGSKDITIGDLAKAIQVSFFHGVEDAIKTKRVNEAKFAEFNKLLYREIFDAEAAQQKIAGSDEYKRAVADHREGLVFDEFVQRAVLPGLQVSEDEGRKYYEQHKAEFTFPAFYGLYSLSFSTAKAAEKAHDKLKAGTDFKWLKANADGQIPEEKRAIDFDGATLSAKALPEDLAAKLKGTKPGDYRIYASGGQQHLVLVKQVTPEQQQPYLSVRPAIARKLSSEMVNKAVADWVVKLRKAHDVKVYLSQIGS